MVPVDRDSVDSDKRNAFSVMCEGEVAGSGGKSRSGKNALAPVLQNARNAARR